MTLPPPTPPPAPSWQLLRSRDRVLGGVCSGIAAASGIDRTLVRLAFIAAALSGLGVLAYIILWIVVPLEDPAAHRVARLGSEETQRWLRIVVVIAAVLGLAALVGAPFGWGRPGWNGFGAPFGFVLVVVGLAYLWSRRRRPAPPPSPSAAMQAPSSASWPAPAAGSVGTYAPSTSTYATTPVPLTKDHITAGLIVARVFGWLGVIAALFMTLAFSAMLWTGALALNAPAVVWLAISGAFLALVGTTVGARRAWPIVVSLAAGAAVIGLVAGLSHFDGSVGNRIDVLRSPKEIRSGYDMAAGRRVLDLTDVTLPEGTTTIEIDHNVGQVDVVLPTNAALDASVYAKVGNIKVLDHERDGYKIDLQVHDTPPSASGHVVLDIEMGAGQVRVCRAGFDTGGELGCGSL